MNTKIHKHRKNIVKWSFFLLTLVIVTLCGIYIYKQNKIYTKYEVLKSVEREDSNETQFLNFSGSVLKYGEDGASYLDEEGKLIWNQTYEMQAPMVDICEKYAVIAEKKGKEIFIMDTQGLCGKIETTMPIQRVQVANQGTVAILMEQNGTGYIHLYDKEGTFLAEGELHTQNSGYPLDLTVSNDGKKLAVSLLDVNEGNVKTTITFYNFDSVGQNEIDNIVGTYSYSDMIFPKIEFLSNERMVAFGNSKTVIFEGTQKPEIKNEIELKGEIRSIFYNEAYLGFVFENENAKQAYQMQIYDISGALILTQNYSMNYNSIEFLDNDEICIRNDLECAIYNLHSVEKFHYNFPGNIWKVMSTGKNAEYVFLLNGETQKVRLK